MASTSLKEYLQSQYGKGYGWSGYGSYGSNNNDNNSIYVGGETDHYRARVYFTVPSDLAIVKSEKLVLCLKGFGQNSGKLWLGRTRGYLSTTNLATSDYGTFDELESPILSYIYRDAACTNRITGGQSCASGNDFYLSFSTANIRPGQTYYIYIIPYLSDDAAITSPGWTNTWMDWEIIGNKVDLTLYYSNSVTVTYDDNGGSGGPGTQAFTYNTNTTVSSTQPRKNSTTSTGFKVDFNARGGTASSTSQTAQNTTSYTFTEWTTNANGTGSSYTAGQQNVKLTADDTWYAQYSSSTTPGSITTPTITSNKPSSTSNRVVTFNIDGEVFTSISSSATTTYSFAGWYDDTSGGTRVAGAGESYTPSSSDTLYAQWTANQGSYASISLPAPDSREGYSFKGWYTAATGGTRIGGEGTSWVPTGTTTLYAQWQINEYTVIITNSFTNEALYSFKVNYNTTIDLKDYPITVDSVYMPLGLVTVRFTDSDTGQIVSLGADKYDKYVYTHELGVYEDGHLAQASLLDTASYTIRTNTTFSICLAEALSNAISFTTPYPINRRGYKFVGWSLDTIDPEMFPPNTLIELDNIDVSHLDFYAYWDEDPDAKANNFYLRVADSYRNGIPYVKVDGNYKIGLATFVKVGGVWRTYSDGVISGPINTLDQSVLDELILG